MLDDLSCNICFEKLESEGERIPAVLTCCGITYCRACLVELRDSGKRCPSCRKRLSSTRPFVTNFQLKEVIERKREQDQLLERQRQEMLAIREAATPEPALPPLPPSLVTQPKHENNLMHLLYQIYNEFRNCMLNMTSTKGNIGRMLAFLTITALPYEHIVLVLLSLGYLLVEFSVYKAFRRVSTSMNRSHTKLTVQQISLRWCDDLIFFSLLYLWVNIGKEREFLQYCIGSTLIFLMLAIKDRAVIYRAGYFFLCTIPSLHPWIFRDFNKSISFLVNATSLSPLFYSLLMNFSIPSSQPHNTIKLLGISIRSHPPIFPKQVEILLMSTIIASALIQMAFRTVSYARIETMTMMYWILAVLASYVTTTIGLTSMLEAFRSISTFAKRKSTKIVLLLFACSFLYTNFPSLFHAFNAHYDFIVMVMLLLSDFLDGHLEVPLAIAVAFKYDFRVMFGFTRLLLLRWICTRRIPVARYLVE
jgi:hypothetical protein